MPHDMVVLAGRLLKSDVVVKEIEAAKIMKCGYSTIDRLAALLGLDDDLDESLDVDELCSLLVKVEKLQLVEVREIL